MSTTNIVQPTDFKERDAELHKKNESIKWGLIYLAMALLVAAPFSLSAVRKSMAEDLRELVLVVRYRGQEMTPESRSQMLKLVTDASDKYRRAADLTAEQSQIRVEICNGIGNGELSRRVAAAAQLYDWALTICSWPDVVEQIGSAANLSARANYLAPISSKLEVVAKISADELETVSSDSKNAIRLYALASKYWAEFAGLKQAAEKRAPGELDVPTKRSREIQALSRQLQDRGERYGDTIKEYKVQQLARDSLEKRCDALEEAYESHLKLFNSRDENFWRSESRHAHERELERERIELEKVIEEWNSGIEAFDKLENRALLYIGQLDSLKGRLEYLKSREIH